MSAVASQCAPSSPFGNLICVLFQCPACTAQGSKVACTQLPENVRLQCQRQLEQHRHDDWSGMSFDSLSIDSFAQGSTSSTDENCELG